MAGIDTKVVTELVKKAGVRLRQFTNVSPPPGLNITSHVVMGQKFPHIGLAVGGENPHGYPCFGQTLKQGGGTRKRGGVTSLRVKLMIGTLKALCHPIHQPILRIVSFKQPVHHRLLIGQAGSGSHQPFWV
jgi:hypothetical protein